MNPDHRNTGTRSLDLTRDLLVRHLEAALRASTTVLAAFLGGSDATGRRDRFSDIDLVCVVEDGESESTLRLIRSALEELSPIQFAWRVPSPTWHGHEQEFIRLRDADAHLIIDVVVMAVSTAPDKRFLEPRRHGTPVVLFDKVGFIRPVALDESSHLQKMTARLDRLRQTFPLFQPLVIRAVERDQPCDAAHFYMQLTLLPTVEVLRMRHCPDRFDFGMRYLRDDLPRPVYTEVCSLALPGSLEGIARCREHADAIFHQTVAALTM